MIILCWAFWIVCTLYWATVMISLVDGYRFDISNWIGLLSMVCQMVFFIRVGFEL